MGADHAVLGLFNDLHIGIHDKPAADLMFEVFDHEDVDGVIANGDVVNCLSVSPHNPGRRMVETATANLREEVNSGREYFEWMRQRDISIFGEGNHEDWINDVAYRSNLVGTLTVRNALEIPEQIEVLPHGYQIRIGSLVIEHGDLLFGRGSGGSNPARQVLNRCSDQTTIFGHVHRDGVAVRTVPDERGIPRTYAAHAIGHMSLPHMHTEYAGRYPDWQQSFALITVYYIDSRPRFTIEHVQIHRDRRGRPFCHHRGRLYK